MRRSNAPAPTEGGSIRQPLAGRCGAVRGTEPRTARSRIPASRGPRRPATAAARSPAPASPTGRRPRGRARWSRSVHPRERDADPSSQPTSDLRGECGRASAGETGWAATGAARAIAKDAVSSHRMGEPPRLQPTRGRRVRQRDRSRPPPAIWSFRSESVDMARADREAPCSAGDYAIPNDPAPCGHVVCGKARARADLPASAGLNSAQVGAGSAIHPTNRGCSDMRPHSLVRPVTDLQYAQDSDVRRRSVSGGRRIGGVRVPAYEQPGGAERGVRKRRRHPLALAWRRIDAVHHRHVGLGQRRSLRAPAAAFRTRS